jgi:outer membrane protein assembly factor BamD
MNHPWHEMSGRSLHAILCSAALIAAVPRLAAQSEGPQKSQPIESPFLAQGTAPDLLSNGDSLADSGDRDKAITVYRFVVRHYPKSGEAPKAQFRLARQLNQKGDGEAAFKEYQSLLQRYPQTPDFEQAVSEQIDIANAYLKGRKVRFLGIPLVSSMEKAEEMYTAILKTAPYSKHAPVSQFNLALAMEKGGKAQEAIAAYQKLIDKYPDSPAAAAAQYQIGYVYQRLGMEGKSQDLSALKESQNNYQDFLIQYPNSEKTQQAGENMKKMVSRESSDTLRIARFYDFNKDFKAASIYYNDVIRRFPQTPDSSAAKTRLDELKALHGEDALRVGQERPENGERLAEKRRLEAQVENTALANYDGPPRKEIVGEDQALPQPKMKGDMRDAQPIPLEEPPAKQPSQTTPPVQQQVP